MASNNDGNHIPTFLDPLKSSFGQSITPGSKWLQNKLWGKGPAQSTYVADTYAALTRDQWQTYVSQFVPIENQLIDYATNRNKPAEAMAEASRDVNSAYDMQQGATARRLQGLGVSLDADEQQAQQRSFGLSKSLADVGAQNVAGALTRQRQQSVLGNPAPQSSTVALAAGG